MDTEKNLKSDLEVDLNDLFGIKNTNKSNLEAEVEDEIKENTYESFYSETRNLYKSFSTICQSLLEIISKLPKDKVELTEYTLVAFNLIEDMSTKYYEFLEDVEKYINTHNDCSNITTYVENSLKKYTQILTSIENVLKTNVHVEVINKKFIFILNKIYNSFLYDINIAKTVLDKYIDYNIKDSISKLKKFEI